MWSKSRLQQRILPFAAYRCLHPQRVQTCTATQHIGGISYEQGLWLDGANPRWGGMLIEVGSFCRSNAVYRRTARKCAFSADWRGNFRPEQIVARGGRTRTPHISQNTHENQIVQRLGRAA